MGGLTGWHLLILLAALVLLFGAKRLPDMARAVGQSARIFKGEIKDTTAEERTRDQQQAPEAAPALDEAPRPVAPARFHAPPGQVTPAQQPTSDQTRPPTG